MEKANTHSDNVEYAALVSLIDRSSLLTPEQKNQARIFAQKAGEEQRGSLTALLQTEADVVQTMVSGTVQKAASQGNGGPVSGKLDEFFRQAARYLSRSGERVEHENEITGAEQLLDNA